MKKSSLILLVAILVAILFGIFGCAALQVAIENKDLEVQSLMSDTIFLQPAAKNKTIFVDLRNTSDKEISLASVASYIQSRGYRLVDDPERAYYVLQGNILFVGKTDPSAASRCLAAGYGGAIVGGVGGALAGAAISHSPLGAGIGGLVGMLAVSAAEVAVNSAVKNVTYTVVTDIQISERSKGAVSESQRALVRQGSSTAVSQAIDRKSNFLLYRTRIVSTANQVNLKWPEALHELEAGLARSISGLF